MEISLPVSKPQIIIAQGVLIEKQFERSQEALNALSILLDCWRAFRRRRLLRVPFVDHRSAKLGVHIRLK